MHKLKLKLDDLRVDTFQTIPGPNGKGTVFAEQCTCYTACTCPGCDTCDNTCAQSCRCPSGSCYGGSCIGGTACESDAQCPDEH